MNIRKPIVLMGVVILPLALGACIVDRFRVGPMQNLSEKVVVGNADSVIADIRMGIGVLEVDGGARDLLEAEFAFNVDDLEPEVAYELSGSSGRLTVEHRDTTIDRIPLGNYDDVRSEWNLTFNDDVSIDMTLSLGAARGDIDLRGMNVSSLDLEVGAGDADIWLGDGSLDSLNIDLGAGSLMLDLTGSWEHDLFAEIAGGVGRLIVYLPGDVGVSVDVQTGVATVDAIGLNKDGNTYTNDAFGESDITLRIDLQVGVGDIELRVQD